MTTTTMLTTNIPPTTAAAGRGQDARKDDDGDGRRAWVRDEAARLLARDRRCRAVRFELERAMAEVERSGGRCAADPALVARARAIMDDLIGQDLGLKAEFEHWQSFRRRLDEIDYCDARGKEVRRTRQPSI